MDWQAAGMKKLWRYNLHYFDYLRWTTLDALTKQVLLDGWIERCKPGMPDAWEPYPTSLRIVNWIKYWLAGAVPTARQLGSLASQLAWLESNLEYHLLANHLLKNAKALVFGGMYFEGHDAERWLKHGLRVLVDEVREQMLPDGGHFERSPMYHCLVLEDLLDVLNLGAGYSGLMAAEARSAIRDAACRGRDFLATIVAGDGRIPLFNDSAFGVAPGPRDVLEYADRVLGSAGSRLTDRIELPDTGFFGYRDGGESLIIDCGPIGPDYQPGHAHCDTLSYELCLDGRRIAVDTGVLDYETGPTRQLARNTAAHNTVRVDGEEQSEIWGAFRVARRARPIAAELGPWIGERLEFRGAHDGYRRLPGRMTHERRVVVERSKSWSVFDLISGTGTRRHTVESFVHLDPTCTVEAQAAGSGNLPRFLIRQEGNDGLQLLLTVTCGSTARLQPGYTFPEFGVRLPNQTLVIERQGTLPLEMHYKIERL